MADAAPNPTRDANGLPLCNPDGCGLYDGKRCSAIGFRPDRFCEPQIVTDREQITGLTCANAELGMLLMDLRRENDALKLRLAAQDSTACPCGACARRHATTVDAAPPDDLLDCITPANGCPHRRVSARPDEHGRPMLAVCLDCDVELET